MKGDLFHGVYQRSTLALSFDFGLYTIWQTSSSEKITHGGKPEALGVFVGKGFSKNHVVVAVAIVTIINDRDSLNAFHKMITK